MSACVCVFLRDTEKKPHRERDRHISREGERERATERETEVGVPTRYVPLTLKNDQIYILKNLCILHTSRNTAERGAAVTFRPCG